MTLRVCPRCGASNAGGLAACPRCLLLGDDAIGTDALESQGEPVALRLPGLVVHEELGRGGMGRVLRAHHAALGRDVAVKLLPPEHHRSTEFRARFAREARVLASLDHPHIVKVHDFGTTERDEPYLVMELVRGGSIAECLPMPIPRALSIALDLCAALEHAHARGVVHRDLKPANVLVDADGRAKLGDFGIARLFDEPEALGLTGTSRVLGTPAYMAPEALRGAPPDPLLDVYSLGVLLHQMLTGSLPSAASGASGLPAPLAAAIRRATTADREQRTPSIRELERELRAAHELLDQPTASDPAGTLSPDEQAWSAAVALLFAVATAAGLYVGLVSFTPRVIPADEALPLIAFGSEPVAGGRLLTRARFEIGPTLGAAVAFAVAMLAYGLLLRHWSRDGLECSLPRRPLPEARRVLVLGGVLFSLFVLREALEGRGVLTWVSYIPVLGGTLEFIALYYFWRTLLEARRTHRPLRREWRLWLGMALALFPPGYHLTRIFAV